MSLRASLVNADGISRGEYGGIPRDIEIASVIDPDILRAIKNAALRNALYKVAENEGDEVREVKFKVEYESLSKLLDYVLPDKITRR